MTVKVLRTIAQEAVENAQRRLVRPRSGGWFGPREGEEARRGEAFEEARRVARRRLLRARERKRKHGATMWMRKLAGRGRTVVRLWCC